MLFLFENYALDVNRRELRRDGTLLSVEPQVFDFLVYLINNRDRVVSKDDLVEAVWKGRIVSESTLTTRINAVRKAIGDSGEQQRLVRTIQRKGIRFVGDVQEGASDAPAPPRPAYSQDVTFCRTADGVHLAVATSGEGAPLVKTANWLNHIEFDWQSPVWSPLLELLSSKFQLVRYDERGNGLSDWDVADISFEAFVRDLEAVVDARGLKRFPLLGISQGAAVSIAYAARHPDRVSRLVIAGGYAKGWRRRGSAAEIARREAMLTLAHEGWGQDSIAFRQIFTSLYVPGATQEETRWFNELQRVSTSPDNAARLFTTFAEIDVSDLLPTVKCPTLILHSRDDLPVPFDQGRALAQGISGSRFVALESKNHLILSHEPAWPRFAQEVVDFLSAGD